MLPTVQFDELHVISDLHFGGDRPGRQIFGSTRELTALIEQLRGGDPERRVALAINGDLVDFLAEPSSKYFDPEGAIGKLERVVLEDQAFAPIFKALSKLLATHNRFLLINLGNHDLELALPWVRERLIQLLCGGDPHALSRLSLVFDGSGLRCRVGDATAMLAHGNEVDSWNITDFERLRRIGRDLQFGRHVAPWEPNAGTKMVIEVMNDIKRSYPFVDLLKPEAGAVIPTLLALDPSSINKLRAAAWVAGRLARDIFRRTAGFLSDAPPAGPVRVERLDSVRLPMPPATHTRHREAVREEEKDMMVRAEAALGAGRLPMDLVRSESMEQLGLGSAAWKIVRGRPAHEVLREALEHLDADRSFDIASEDATFRDLDHLAGPDVDFVIAGHTHLERALRRKNGRGCYFNSGTWARLIRIRPEVRGDAAAFKRLFELFKGGDMAALDREKELVLRTCPTVSVVSEAGRAVYGELRHLRIDEAGIAVMEPVANSRLEKQ